MHTDPGGQCWGCNNTGIAIVRGIKYALRFTSVFTREVTSLFPEPQTKFIGLEGSLGNLL